MYTSRVNQIQAQFDSTELVCADVNSNLTD